MESRPIVVCVKISRWVRPRLHLPVNSDYLLSLHQRLKENFQFQDAAFLLNTVYFIIYRDAYNDD